MQRSRQMSLATEDLHALEQMVLANNEKNEQRSN